MRVGAQVNCFAVLAIFLKKRCHSGIANDEYGGVAGAGVFEDLLETMLGVDIFDETDREINMQEVTLKRKKGLN